MEAVIFLLAIATLIGMGFLGAFYWAWKSGQFENMEGPAMRMIFDDDDRPD